MQYESKKYCWKKSGMAPERRGDRNCKYTGSEYRLSKNRPHIARKFPSQVSDTYPRQKNQCGVEQDDRTTKTTITASNALSKATTLST
jgi:hypothetical protein